MPKLYRHLALAGAQRIAQSFKLSMSLVHRCAAYQHIRGPQISSAARAARAARAIPAAAPAVDAFPTTDLAAAPTPAPEPVQSAPEPMRPAPEPAQLTERPQEDDLDLIARGIAKAIAAATAHGLNQPGRR
jgi:hypothetical protein